MLTHKYIDRICIAAALLAVFLTLVFMQGERIGIGKIEGDLQYTQTLFDSSRVHRINIEIDGWPQFIQNALAEEYVLCNLDIDGERFNNVGIRSKGNNSLRLTEQYGLSRYSLKLEFDHFVAGGNYHGLDKFSLDASFQDNSYMKTYLTYDMMSFMEVPSPLCSYVWVTVNGEDWGLFLAIEEPEESFAKRNFGKEYGELYKPDYRSLNAENADVALKYIDDDPDSYPNIFENAKFAPTELDKLRVINALHTLSSGENLESAINVDEVLRYFTVQVFVMNWDSYLGYTGHNYFLYESDGVISILPWDYNLAFGTYALGMTNPIKDPTILINYPINTPAEGKVMLNRPLYHELMKHDEYFSSYHTHFESFISDYFSSGLFEVKIRQTEKLISPYVQLDPTAFCSYEDHKLAVQTLYDLCILRAQSISKQLSGEMPITLRDQQLYPAAKLDASHIQLEHLGDFEDLKLAREKHEHAMAAFPN